MDKRETVIESIKKLLSLGVSDDEIAENLYDVGIEKPEAYSLIREARGVSKPIIQNPSNPQTPSNQQGQVNSSQKSSEDLFEETVNQLSMNDQIVQQLPLEKKAEGAQVSSNKSTSDSDDIANRIMSDVASQDGEEIEEEEDVEDLEKESSPVQISPKATTQTSQPNITLKKSPSPTQNISQTQQPQQTKQSVPLQTPTQSVSQSSQTQSFFQNPKESNQTSTPLQSQKTSQPLPQSQKPVYSSTAIPPIDFTQSVKENKPVPSFEMSPDFEELWKKGIVIAVNTKLAEMKKLKENVDAEVEQKVDEAVRKELYQFKILLDSQKELIISSNKDALEQKQKEIVFIIDSKIAELKQYNKQLADNLSAIESARKQQELSLGQITTALEDAKRTKAQLIVELNSEMIKSKSQAQSFLDTASLQLKQMDERVNKTLELEKNIADGMLAQAEQKIETLAIQRADELIASLEVELNRLQTISKKISPETLDQKISVLEEFRKQFLNSMQENLSQINMAIEQLNQKNAFAERELTEKTLAIDAKLEELTKFEKEFTQRMNRLIK